MSGALAVGALAAAGTFLLLQRGLVRAVLGFVLVEHALNVAMVLAGGTTRRGVPIVEYSEPPADPLVQAFALTAIVIGLGTTAFLLALAFQHATTHREDDVEQEP